MKVFIWLILSSSLGFYSCESNDAGKGLDEFPEILRGTFQMTVKTDTADITFDIQLVTALDSAVYGTIRSEEIQYDAPIALDSMSRDSLFFHYYTSILVISKHESVIRGRVDTWRGYWHNVEMEKLSDSVDNALLESRNILPMKLDIDVSSFAWAAPKREDQIYFVAEKQIFLAQVKGKVWETEPLEYDSSIWEFYSIGLNSDQSKLIAHGKPKHDHLPHKGKGDYYELELLSPEKVGFIKHLPSVSTNSFDIFPSYTSNDGILISTWGNYENHKNKGKGDIFLAEPVDVDSFKIIQLDLSFNSQLAEAGAFMDKEGRFLLFHQNDYENNLKDRIYISYREEEGWSEFELVGPPVNMGFNWTYAPRLDPDAKFLFFNSGFRGRSEIFRVPTEDISELATLFK